MNPESINQWFSTEQQRHYVLMFLGRVGLTRRRAEYFVRLWAYLLLKQQQELGKPFKSPLTKLYPLAGFVPCSHREAAAIFYGNQNRGSDRAAGMMIDKLVALGLIKKHFDGNTICLQISSSFLPELTPFFKQAEPVQLKPADFNPRTDTIPVATFLARHYKWMNTNVNAPQRIAKVLRSWTQHYQTGFRVLRRCDNDNPVGFYALFPTTKESEENFFRTPCKSLYLTSNLDTDPFKMAFPKDPDCTSIFIRSWGMDEPYLQREYVCMSLKDVQKTVVRMQSEFPNLCDIYALPFIPFHEALLFALGFQKTYQGTQPAAYWSYTSVDQLLALDMEQVVSDLELEN